MTDKLPPLPDFGWTCLCTKCGRTWEIEKPQKSADCQCGYAAFVVQNKRPTVEQMQNYARQAVREAVPEAVTGVLLPYMESYKLMAKMATEKGDNTRAYCYHCVAVDIESNMIPAMIAAAKGAK